MRSILPLQTKTNQISKCRKKWDRERDRKKGNLGKKGRKRQKYTHKERNEAKRLKYFIIPTWHGIFSHLRWKPMCYLQHWVGLLFDGGMRETNGYANLQNTERYPNECDKDRKAKNYSHSIHSSTWIWMASTVGVWMCRLRWCANECTRAVLSFTKSMWNTTRIMNNIFEYVYVCALVLNGKRLWVK